MPNDATASEPNSRSNGSREGRDSMGLLGAAVAGATLMYFLDPARGTRRQKLLRDRFVHAVNAGADFLGTARRDSANRVRGIAAKARTAFRDRTTDDRVLEERVRAELGRTVSHPGAVDVESAGGTVILRGFVLKRERDELIDRVNKVAGVEGVDDQLEVHETAENVSALQGTGRPRERRFELAQANWSPAARLATGAAGIALVSYGARKKGVVGSVCSVTGTALLARSLTNQELDRIVGVGGGRQAVDVQKTININAPLQDVFAFFTAWERWPEWMSHVRSVTGTGPRGGIGERTHWEVDGPAGMKVSWDAEVTEFVPNKLVSWRSVEGAPIRQAGTLRLDPNDDGSVRVDIQLTYNPPGGVAGHAVARLLGRDPRRQMNADLARLKTTIESGRAPHDAAATT